MVFELGFTLDLGRKWLVYVAVSVTFAVIWQHNLYIGE